MDPSKTGKGILASLEHKAAEPSRRATISAPSSGRGAALTVGIGVLAGALLAWWLYSGPSPVIVHESLPPMPHAAVSAPAPAAQAGEAAAIVDEAPLPAPPPPSASPAAAAVQVPAPIAAAVLRHDRVAPARAQAKPHARPKPKPKVKQVAATRETVRPAPHTGADTDVALLSALVAHANGRDVVEPRTGDSTEGLLQRCRRVGGEEGRLCRVHICATRAGDMACRAN